ncbi:MAG: hypothetical protein IJA71_04905, partial [Clostridia bacterium]|nr:hypothetical protein [Clostridia bacterium]
MNATADSTSYPQFLQAEHARGGSVPSGKDLAAYRCWPAIGNMPRGLVKTDRLPGGLLLTFGTEAKAAVHSFTHETPIDLYREEAPTVERLYLGLEIWSDTVFRVRFSREEEPSDPFAGIPEDARMLIGRPEQTRWTLEDRPEEL